MSEIEDEMAYDADHPDHFKVRVIDRGERVSIMAFGPGRHFASVNISRGDWLRLPINHRTTWTPDHELSHLDWLEQYGYSHTRGVLKGFVLLAIAVFGFWVLVGGVVAWMVTR